MNSTETITIAEVGDLLKQLAARDQRTTGQPDIVAWWNDLNTAVPPVGYREAQAAANYYYAVVWPAQEERNRFRLTAPKVIELAHNAQKGRLENFVYQATPGETGAEFIVNYNRQRNAVASGQVQPVPSITQALKPRPVAALVAGVAAARVLPPEIADIIARRRPPGSSIPCPYCHAQVRRHCRTSTGRELQTMHASRIATWATFTVACPICGVSINKGCMERGRLYDGAHRERIEAAGDAS